MPRRLSRKEGGGELHACSWTTSTSASPHRGPGRSSQSEVGYWEPSPSPLFPPSPRRGDPLVSAAPSMVAGSWGAGDPVLAISTPQRSRSGEEGVTRGTYGGRNWLWWWFKERRGEVHSSVSQSSPGHSLCARPCSDLPLAPLAGKARSWESKKSAPPPLALKVWFLPSSSSSSNTWELGRNATFQAPPQTY